MTTKIKLTTARIQAAVCPSDKADTTLWDADALGLGLRIYKGGQRSWWFQYRIDGKAARIKIGDADPTKGWPIGQARDEARRLRVLVDQGTDPRTEKQEKAQERLELKAKKEAEGLTLGEAWDAMIEQERAKVGGKLKFWSEHHFKDHEKIMRAPGIQRIRSNVPTTKAGPLWPMRDERLVDIPALLPEWFEKEMMLRPTTGKKALTLLKNVLRKNKVRLDDDTLEALKDIAPRTIEKEDALELSQLPAWWTEIERLQPMMAGYLKFLLLTGARKGEAAGLRWTDVDFRWKKLKVRDKNAVKDGLADPTRWIPMPAYIEHILLDLKQQGYKLDLIRAEKHAKATGIPLDPENPLKNIEEHPWVFRASTKIGPINNPHKALNVAVKAAGLDALTIHGIRRTFNQFAEAAQAPAGAIGQICGHRPSGTAEKHYKKRSMDTLLEIHQQVENFILNAAQVEIPAEDSKVIHLKPRTMQPKAEIK